LDDRFRDVAVDFIRSRYGDCVVEISHIFEYGVFVEVSGVFRRVGERSPRRFTLKIERDSLIVKGFGMR
jgi:hypothetical protein